MGLKNEISKNPGKDDVHEQREPHQPAEGVVHEPGKPAPKVHPWRRKLPTRSAPRNIQAPPPGRTDPQNRPG